MADAIDSVLGFGNVTGSSATPITLITLSNATRCHSLQLTNQDATNWLFAKAHDDPGPYLVAGPKQVIEIKRGGPTANNLTKVLGWGATPSNAGTASILTTLLARALA